MWKLWYFNLQIKFNIYLITKLKKDNPFSYPILVSLMFDRKYYWERYLRGISIKKSIDHKINIISGKMLRDMDRVYDPKVYFRYKRFVTYIENKAFIEEEERKLTLKFLEDDYNKSRDQRDLD